MSRILEESCGLCLLLFFMITTGAYGFRHHRQQKRIAVHRQSKIVSTDQFETKIDLWLDLRNILPGTAALECIKSTQINGLESPVSGVVYHESYVPSDAVQVDLMALVVRDDLKIEDLQSSKAKGRVVKLRDIEEAGSDPMGLFHKNGWLLLDRTKSSAELARLPGALLGGPLLPLMAARGTRLLLAAESPPAAAQAAAALWAAGDAPGVPLLGALPFGEEERTEERRGGGEDGNGRTDEEEEEGPALGVSVPRHALLLGPDPALWELGAGYAGLLGGV